MLTGRGIALGLGGMNLTDLGKRGATLVTAGRLLTMEKRTSRKKSQNQPDTTKKRVKIKKPFNRRAFWLACRSITFGTLLVLLGAAMCTIGYYKEFFALENTLMADNVTALVVNPTKKVQFHSLAFIGPVVMGAGAFILMMACVTTLESRDRHSRIHQQQQSENTPLASGALPAATPPPPPPPPPPASSKPPPTGGKPAVLVAKQDAPDPKSPYQPAELVAVSSSANGMVNRCFTRDDSKTASKPDTDSGPSGTTTTTLTWSKNGGPRVETEQSMIDRRNDQRALLQRYLEDQSKLMENRLNRRIRIQREMEGDAARSASLDAPGYEKTDTYKRMCNSEEIQSQKNIVEAEVHRPGEYSPLNTDRSDKRNEYSVISNDQTDQYSSMNDDRPDQPDQHGSIGNDHSSKTGQYAQIDNDQSIPINPDQSINSGQFRSSDSNRFDPCDKHASTSGGRYDQRVISGRSNQASEHSSINNDRSDKPGQFTSMNDQSMKGERLPVTSDRSSMNIDHTNQPRLPMQPSVLLAPVITLDSLESYSPSAITPSTPCSVTERPSDQSSYVTVIDTAASPTTPVQPRTYNTFQQNDQQPTGRKLYDSIFLAETLRKQVAAEQEMNKDVKYIAHDAGQGTGALCKNWTEMNANYLSKGHNI